MRKNYQHARARPRPSTLETIGDVAGVILAGVIAGVLIVGTIAILTYGVQL